MTTTTLDDRFAAVRRRIKDGTLTRKRWEGVDADGRDFACLLLAAFPEVGHGAHYDACPALGISESWARLAPWIDDAGTEAAWPATVVRWADLTHRACRVFTPADWTAFDYECRELAEREAWEAAAWEAAAWEAAADRLAAAMLDALERRVAGREP